MGPITQHSGTAEAHFFASVDLGQDGAPWSYEGRFAMRKTPAGWRVVWSPTVINPGLRQGLRMAVVTTIPRRAALLDAEGVPLIHPSAAWIAQVRPGQLPHPEATADAFAAVTGLDDQQVLSVIRAAPQSHPLTLVTLSPAAYATLRKKLRGVPGLQMRRVSRPLFDTSAADVTGTVGTELAPVLQAQGVSYRPGTTVGVSGLQKVYQRQAGRRARDRGHRREPGWPPGGGAEAVGLHPGNRGPHDHRGRGAAGRGQRGRGPACCRRHRRGAG